MIKISESKLKQILRTFLSFYIKKEDEQEVIIDNMALIIRTFGEEEADAISKAQ